MDIYYQNDKCQLVVGGPLVAFSLYICHEATLIFYATNAWLQGEHMLLSKYNLFAI